MFLQHNINTYIGNACVFIFVTDDACRSSAASLRVVPRPRESELYFHCQTYSSIFIFNQFTALLLHWPNKNRPCPSSLSVLVKKPQLIWAG